MGVVSEELEDVNDDLAHEELLLLQLDVGRDQATLRAEESGQLKCSKLEGRSHNQPHQRPEKTFFGKHTKQPTSPPKI